jgi:magnesium-transporting ATPase (P-type)
LRNPLQTAQQQASRDWHALDEDLTFEHLASGSEGLTRAEAERRLAIYGRNSLPQARRVHPVVRFLKHLNNPLIYLLLAGALAAAGQATGVVVATGLATQIGRISTLLGEVDSITTPLLRQIGGFARKFSLFVVAASAGLFTFTILMRGFAWGDATITRRLTCGYLAAVLRPDLTLAARLASASWTP